MKQVFSFLPKQGRGRHTAITSSSWHGIFQAQRADIFIATGTTISELRRSGIVGTMSPQWGFRSFDLAFYPSLQKFMPPSPCPLPAPVKAKPMNKRGERDQG